MNYLGSLGRVIGGLKGFYSGINGATLTGAIDVLVVEQEDGSFKCSPFHVRFGKLGVLRSREKVVDIEVNGVSVPIRMKLGDSGEAFFVEEVDADDDFEDENLATSPLPSSPRFSDSDNRMQPSETEQVIEKPENDSKTGNEVAITITEDDCLVADDNGASNTNDNAISGKSEDSKGRKRRRKRRRNQGSRSDIKIEPQSSTAATELMDNNDNETIFKMDEDLPAVADALKDLELTNNVGNIPHTRSFHRDFYSDTEIEATVTPPTTRPSTPIQSDSEYEISKIQKQEVDDEVGKWPWGELPSTGNTTPATTPLVATTMPFGGDQVSSDEDSGNRSENKSMLSGMFSFMKRTNPSGSTSGGETGIYLDDLNFDNLDPEVRALYFPQFAKQLRESKKDQDDDGESGKGNSLPQSPAPGSSPRSAPMLPSFMENMNRERSESGSSVPTFEAISFCGNNLNLFEQSQLTFDELVENPEIILTNSPESIVVKIDGKMIPWAAAMPQLLSSVFFKRPLPSEVYNKLMSPYKKDSESGASISRANSVSSKEGPKRGGYSWFPWRRSNTAQESDQLDSSTSPDSTLQINNINDMQLSMENKSENVSINTTLLNTTTGSITSSSDESEGGGGQEKTGRVSRASTLPNPIPGAVEKFKKTMRLSSDQINALGLRYGQNEAVFSVTTAYQGTTAARCHIYLWKYDDRVVVSDIDGTITKSDVLGHILPIIGNDWAQSGVAQLFTQINANGYKMLYLSARAIGQAGITRDYLRSIKQGDVTLPDGPLLLNPTSLMSALHREVIEKKPEDFKIACLKDVQTLFPQNPFYAGYGNKINDVWSYRAVDINISRIFTINHKGELRHALTRSFSSTYSSLVELVEHIFPAYKSHLGYSHLERYNSFEFWRDPILSVQGLSSPDAEEGASKPIETA